MVKVYAWKTSVSVYEYKFELKKLISVKTNLNFCQKQNHY